MFPLKLKISFSRNENPFLHECLRKVPGCSKISTHFLFLGVYFKITILGKNAIYIRSGSCFRLANLKKGL